MSYKIEVKYFQGILLLIYGKMVDSLQDMAYRIYLKGIVQGVGFRPFVYRLASELNLKGWVENSTSGLIIHAEGCEGIDFYQRLLAEAPPLSRITNSYSEEVKPEGFSTFEIRQSANSGNKDVLISPDIATCSDCLTEIRTIDNRRYAYPFTNCTNCGPRYTIIQDIPYDRVRTTMASFPMCKDCSSEYYDPADRRFHAQPVACNVCGPYVQLIDSDGNKLPGIGIKELAEGAIVAVKGLGGFHLVCDAKNEKSVNRLRERKERGLKPFALMAKSIEKALEEVNISGLEQELLNSPAAPIVLLERKTKQSSLASGIAPNLHTLGIMLPYTPLHHLLLDGAYDFLVMTSANLSGRPLIYKDEDALESLKGIADYILLHDREIYHPCDDSVLQVIGDQPVFFRRARGYVPMPLEINLNYEKSILGVGGELKNCFCLSQGNRAFVSQYIGDLEGYENFQRFLQELKSFQRVVNVVPHVISHDLHPNYQTTRYAKSTDLPKVPVQHHHAHLVSVLGEHGYSEKALGIVCDGTGYGVDGRIWGFEFLFGNAQEFERKAHLEYLPLPGGDAGTKYPLRIAYAYVKYLLGIDEETEFLWGGLTKEERRILDNQIEKEIQVFPTSSAGRLFDAVSALLGICNVVTYEGQAAIELESTATNWFNAKDEQKISSLYEIEVLENDHVLSLGVKKLFEEIIKELGKGESVGKIAYKFHMTIAKVMVDTARRLGVGKGPLVLSGGVFQNKLLTERVISICVANEIEVLRSRDLPPGDSGLSFGQVLIASEVSKKCV